MSTVWAYWSAMIPARAAIIESETPRTSTGMRMTSGSLEPPPLAPFASGLDAAFLSVSGVSGFSIFRPSDSFSTNRACDGAHAGNRLRLRAAGGLDRPDGGASRSIPPAGPRSRHRIVRTSLDCRSPGVFATRRCPRRQRHARLCRAAAGSSGTQRWGSRVPTAESSAPARPLRTEPGVESDIDPAVSSVLSVADEDFEVDG